ncbi:MAG: hypothetical protein ABFS28_14205 [Bacteroidota bacterium]
MNKKVIQILSGTALLIFFAGWSPLMGQSKEQIEKFKKERKAYFNEELELTDAEAKAFWPLYDDFHNRKMKLVEDEKNTYSYAHTNAENLNDEEILDILAKAHKLKEDRLKLEAEYYQGRFLKALPAKKVLKLGKVEWDFRRHLMRELRGQGHGEPGKRGERPGRGPGGGQDSGLGGGQGGHPGSIPMTPYFISSGE